MKAIAIIFLLLSPCLYSQVRTASFNEIDRRVGSIPFSSIDTLASRLAALGNTDLEKVRAIFRWITDHIDYNVRSKIRNRNLTALFYEEPDDSTAAFPSLSERVAKKVLHKKVAFCDGYSRLFKTLCDYAGIQCEIVTGFGRTNFGNNRFAVNHVWNAVCIDSAWRLLDVTWASGYTSYSNDFIRNYNDFYFLTPPEDFIRDHYPEDPQWTLLKELPVYREFRQSPFRHSGYVKAGITAHSPTKGIIEASQGDTIKIELQTMKPINKIGVSTLPNIDTTETSLPFTTYSNGEKLSFNYVISSGTGEWLYIFCNDELAMRYKLNLKTAAVALRTAISPVE